MAQGYGGAERLVQKKSQEPSIDGRSGTPLKGFRNIPENEAVLLRKKDKAIYDFGDKESGVTTSTKVIDPKDGTKGLYKYRYVDTNKIDSFNGTNIAKADTAKGTEYEDLPTPEIKVKVSDHDLSKKNKEDETLTQEEIGGGDRNLHFRHADNEHGIDRTNKYTWHHKRTYGKMELIDMNVHGAMWHYGGISGWGASLHSGTTDDDPSD